MQEYTINIKLQFNMQIIFIFLQEDSCFVI